MSDPRHLLTWHQLPMALWERLVGRAREHERSRFWQKTATGKSIALMFFNPSLRTRTSMELAAAELGAHCTTIVPGSGTWAFAWSRDGVMNGVEAEHIEEAVGVMSEYYDAIGVRLFASLTDLEADRTDARLSIFAGASSVPVVNLESAFWHPCQELADAATIAQHFEGRPQGRRFVLSWAHHPRALPVAVPNSALMMAARSGMEITIACPDGFDLDRGVVDEARSLAASTGGTVTETRDLDSAIAGAHVVYAKAWSGRQVYEDPDGEAARRALLSDWRITESRMRTTDHGVFMHCLPVRRNVVVDTAVLKSPQSLHLKQAGFRLHAQKAILEHVWNLL
ncbi:MAG: N-acetylornithine carbamoyltransferase [Bacteroidota bacterium]